MRLRPCLMPPSSFLFPTPVLFSLSTEKHPLRILQHLNKEELEMALNKAKQIVSSNPVVVFSKTYCGYCTRVKSLFTQLKAAFKFIELDGESDGGDMQAALAEWTGRRTVPNVFIAGKNIGGCDSVLELHKSGQLVTLLTNAGAIANNPAQQKLTV